MELLIEREHLLQQDLMGLIRGECLALRISNFHDVAQCEDMAQRVVADSALQSFRLAPSMQRFGPSLGESTGSDAAMQRYQATAAEDMARLRELCAPYLTPIDKLRLVLDEAWDGGARLATVNGQKAFAGVVRVMHSGGATDPHQDKLIAPQVALSSFVKEQLGANVYLRTSEVGGELDIWNLSLPREEYQSMRVPGRVGVQRDRLPPSSVRISPEVGDLILFRSTNLHAICTSSGGPRVTHSTFIGYRSKEDPLLFYC